MNNFIVSMENVGYGFPANIGNRKNMVIKNLSFNVRPGEFFTIIGPSGCGKSTILRIIAGLLKPSEGNVIRQAKKTSMIFQNFALFPWLTVAENIEFGLKMAGVAQKEKNKQIKEKIEELYLAGIENKLPHELSGGMKQRVGIGRAFAIQPDLLLADEPFSNLDPFTAEKLRLEIIRLWKKYKITVVLVTHLTEEAIELSDRVIILGNKPALIQKEIIISLPRPRNKRSPEFFGLLDEINGLIRQ